MEDGEREVFLAPGQMVIYRQDLEVLFSRIDEMRKEIKELRQDLRKVHDFLYDPPMEGHESRATMIDQVLSAVLVGKLTARVALWLAGAVAAISAAWAVLKGAR